MRTLGNNSQIELRNGQFQCVRRIYYESKLPMWVHECDAIHSLRVVTTILPTFCSKTAKKYWFIYYCTPFGWRTSLPWNFQPQTFQPWILEPWGWKVHGWKVWGWKVHGWKVWGWKVWGWSLGLKSPGLKCPSTL